MNRFLLLPVVLLTGLSALACSKVGDVLDYLFCGRVVIAELDARHQRTVLITADNCWELGRPLYYEVREGKRVITPTTYFTVDDGDEPHDYELIYAEGGALVGVLDTTSKQAELVLIQDFKSGELWQSAGRKERSMLERLRRENPHLPMPQE